MEILYKLFWCSIGPALNSAISFRNINPYRLTKKDFLLMILLISIGTPIIMHFNMVLSSLYLYSIPFLFVYMKSKKFFISIMLSAFTLIIMVLTDNFIGFIFVNILKFSFKMYTLEFTMILITISIATYFTTKLSGNLLNKYGKQFINASKNKYTLLIFISILTTAMLFIININWNENNNPNFLTKINSFVFIIYGIILFFVCSILMMSIKKDEIYKQKQIQMQNLQEYTENLEELYTDMRKFRHDYINIISSIAGFIDSKDLAGLEQHFNENIYPLNNKINNNNYKLGLLKNLEVPAVKGIVSSKMLRAQELGLDTIIDITEPISSIPMDIIDFCRCLGILIDNAIEASLESEEKILNIAFINKNTSIILVIINSVSGNLPPISKLYKQGFSTKGPDRGLGLSNLKDILKHYDHVTIDTSFDNNKFIQELIISSSN